MKRILKHWLFPHWRVRRMFSKAALHAIEAAVAESESKHCGELRFVVEGALGFVALWRGITARDRAVQVFSQMHVWDTEHNSGVLIYVQLADRRVEIVADRGIVQRVGQETWQDICTRMEQSFRVGKFQAGAVAGVVAVGDLLEKHFPAQANNPDELPNAPVMI